MGTIAKQIFKVTIVRIEHENHYFVGFLHILIKHSLNKSHTKIKSYIIGALAAMSNFNTLYYHQNHHTNKREVILCLFA